MKEKEIPSAHRIPAHPSIQVQLQESSFSGSNMDSNAGSPLSVQSNSREHCPQMKQITSL